MARQLGTIARALVCGAIVAVGGTSTVHAAVAGWQQLPALEAFDGVHPSAAAPWGAGFVVVGSEPAVIEEEVGAPSHPVVLRSPDGRSWARAAFATPDGSRPWATLASVAVRGSRIVVGGLLQTVYDPVGGSEYQPAIWWSDDGVTFTPAALPAVEGPPSEVRNLVSTAAGFVAASGYIDEPTFLRSTDGESWELAERDPADIPGGRFVDRLTATPDAIIAYGVAYDADRCRPGFWWSVDGSRWTAATSSASFPACAQGGESGALYRTPQRWLATISGTDDPHPVSASLDGMEWHSTAEPGDLDAVELAFVEPAPDGYLGLGLSAAWASTDGSSWSEVPMSVREPVEAQFSLVDLAIGGDTALALGVYRSSISPLFASTTAFVRDATVAEAPSVPGPTPPPTETGSTTSSNGVDARIAALAAVLACAATLVLAVSYAVPRTRA